MLPSVKLPTTQPIQPQPSLLPQTNQLNQQTTTTTTTTSQTQSSTQNTNNQSQSSTTTTPTSGSTQTIGEQLFYEWLNKDTPSQ